MLSRLTNFYRWASVCRGAVLHAIQAHALSMEPGARVELFDCIVLTAVGEPPSMAFDFRWVGGEMSFVLVYGDNSQVPFIRQNCYGF